MVNSLYEHYIGHCTFSRAFDIHNVSETESVFVIRHQGRKQPREVDPLERSSLTQWILANRLSFTGTSLPQGETPYWDMPESTDNVQCNICNICSS